MRAPRKTLLAAVTFALAAAMAPTAAANPETAPPDFNSSEFVMVLPKIDSSYTSYQGALGTSGNEASAFATAVPLTMTIIFP